MGMHRARRAILALVAAGLTAAPLRADIIRSRANPPALPAASTAPLAHAGLTAPDLARLDPSDVAYFASRPERIRVVGDLGTHTFWYERYGGYLLGVGAVVVITSIIISNRDT
jgi:hypothetical protein